MLYYQGNAELLKLAEEEMITVVGSRKITKYTEILMDQILSKACLNGVGVVSGLAYGVDLLSHQIAVNNNAPTIGVLGGGLDRQSFYPKANLKLKKQIIDQGGLVMTEYAPGTEPNRYTFPKRNRILAALTPVTWVVQAQHKSGSLITANYAQDLNKTIAATPGSILENAYEGNIELIKNGANIITEPEDIMTLLGLSISLSSEAVEVQIDDSTQNQIHKVLTLKPQNIEEICAKTGFDHTATSTALSMLELSSYAKHMGENDWIRGK